MTTSENSQQTDFWQTELKSMSSQADSRAKISALQGQCGLREAGYTQSDRDSGSSTRDSFASFDLDTQSWRTYQTCLLETGDLGLEPFSGTWPRSGMMRNGIAYQLPPLVLNTTEIGSLPFPTPASRDYKGAVRPETMEAKGSNPDTNSLPDAIEYRGESGRLNPTWVEWLMGYPSGHTALED
jgi:hypothetical protein